MAILPGPTRTDAAAQIKLIQHIFTIFGCCFVFCIWWVVVVVIAVVDFVKVFMTVTGTTKTAIMLTVTVF